MQIPEVVDPERGVARADAIHQALHRIVAARDLDGLMATTRRAARTLTSADGVTFVLRSGNNCFYVRRGRHRAALEGMAIPDISEISP